jgi:hypothetical protein
MVVDRILPNPRNQPLFPQQTANPPTTIPLASPNRAEPSHLNSHPSIPNFFTSHSLRHHFAFLLPLTTFPSPYPVNSVNPVQNKKPPTALDSRRWSLDLLLRSLLKCQELMPDPSDSRRWSLDSFFSCPRLSTLVPRLASPLSP